MKRAFLAVIALFVTATISAQKLEIGFIGGYQHTFPYALVSGDVDKIDFNPRGGMGFHVGGYFGWNFYGNLGMDFQLLYAMRSYSFNMDYVNDTLTTIFKRQVFNLELPVHLYYRFRVNSRLTVAPVVGVAVAASIHGKDIAYRDIASQKPINKETENDALFGKKEGRMYRFGLSSEVGAMFNFGNWGIRPLYSVTLTNLTRQGFGWTYALPSGQTKYLFNHVVRLSAIYTFRVL